MIKTNKNYKRYELTDDGVSPRGIPGFGDGVVVVDPHEHDEEGHINEDQNIRTKMVEKRHKKLVGIKNDSIPPELIGLSDYKILIVGWGSTYGIIKEALDSLNREDIAFLYFKQVHPLHETTKKYLDKADMTVIFENNIESQFANQIKLQTDYIIDKKILKYNGRPFSVEEVIESLENLDGSGLK